MIHIDLRNLAASLPKYEADPHPSAIRQAAASGKPVKHDPFAFDIPDCELEPEPLTNL